MSQRISAIGVMSGTSLDGLDIAYCSFSKNGVKWSYVIYAARCVDYGPDWRKRLAEAHNLSGEELALLDADLGRFIANQVNLLLMDKGLPRPDIIASHGHTVFHAPYRGYTVQIGSGAHIASGTGITTV
ncbi:MAG: anhydro-N-acetylmuramic acid kinase, partial [Flavobacteriales bacterium]|nr:anhydro-N-acetylmuramic acid kinase [Flavobacteriales bacterium]